MTRTTLRLPILIACCLLLFASAASAQDTPAEQGDNAPVTVPDAPVDDAEEAASAPVDETPTVNAAAEAAPASEQENAASELSPEDAALMEGILTDEPDSPILNEPEEPAEQEEPTEKKLRWTDFVDTKISFSIADSNVRENSEFSPAMGIGQYNETGGVGSAGAMTAKDINQTHLVLHHYSDGYLAGVLTEAALVLKFNLASDPYTGEAEPAVADDGSFVRLGYIFDYKTDKSMVLDITGFPFDAERFLLGFHYNLTWAGKSSFPQNRESVPGARLGFQWDRWGYAFIGFKSHLQPKKDKQNTERVPVETVYALLSGIGVRPIDGLMIEANGGMIQKGDNPSIADPTGGDQSADDILAWGVSARVQYSQGLEIGDRMDLHLYQNDPRKRLSLVRRDEYQPGMFSFSVSAEGNFLSQNLADPDPNQIGGTKPFNAPAALVGAKFKYDYWRFYLEGAYRSLEFLVFDTPGYDPFRAFPDTAESTPEIYGIVAFDYHIKPAYLTLGLSLGYKRPATYRGEPGSPIVVVKARTASSSFMAPFDRPTEILPDGKTAADILSVQFNSEFDLSDWMSMMLQVSYTMDQNRSKLRSNPDNSEELVKVFEDENVTNAIGIAFIVQAMF